MIRVCLTVVLVLAGLVTLELAFGEACDVSETDLTVGLIVSGACFGGLVSVASWNRFRRHRWLGWAATLGAAILAGWAVWILVIINWVEECSA
jgi:hypothetical protein